MKIGQSGKYFESQFVNSFHKLFMGKEQYYIIRLKDSGSFKKAHDVGDYLVFYRDVVFNIELKARVAGVLYKSSLDKEQINKWASFEYDRIRVPLIVLKNTDSKRVSYFFKNEFLNKYETGKITEKDTSRHIDYNFSELPYRIDLMLENCYSIVKMPIKNDTYSCNNP